MICVPKISLWETVATIQIAQALSEKHFYCDELDQYQLLLSANLNRVGAGEGLVLNYDRAYRTVEDTQDLIVACSCGGALQCQKCFATGQVIQRGPSYVDVLAACSGLSAEFESPKFMDLRNNGWSGQDGIVVCPFAVKPGLELPVAAWRAIVRHLRTYGYPVYLMGDRGQWQDDCAYLEKEILSEQPIVIKLSYLANAKLIVGVPNEWTWAAAGFNTKMVYFYPERMPTRRWFSFASANFGRIVYDPDQLQIAVLLSGLRQLIAQL